MGVWPLRLRCCARRMGGAGLPHGEAAECVRRIGTNDSSRRSGGAWSGREGRGGEGVLRMRLSSARHDELPSSAIAAGRQGRGRPRPRRVGGLAPFSLDSVAPSCQNGASAFIHVAPAALFDTSE